MPTSSVPLQPGLPEVSLDEPARPHEGSASEPKSPHVVDGRPQSSERGNSLLGLSDTGPKAGRAAYIMSAVTLSALPNGWPIRQTLRQAAAIRLISPISDEVRLLHRHCANLKIGSS